MNIGIAGVQQKRPQHRIQALVRRLGGLNVGMAARHAAFSRGNTSSEGR
jgi:hypothetical protein